MTDSKSIIDGCGEETVRERDSRNRMDGRKVEEIEVNYQQL